MIIYEDRYIKIYAKSNILQHKARQIGTKCLKNRKKCEFVKFKPEIISIKISKASNTSQKS